MTVSNTRHSHDILIADARIKDLHVLLAGRAAGLETWLVQPDEDALGLIFKALAQPGLARLHLLAHGAPGEIRLGNRPLTAADFRARFDGAAQRDLDIALWSCGTGAGEAGQEFVRALAAATGARVSAATGLVGAAALGGQWELDGAVAAPFSETARDGFAGVLQYWGVDLDTTDLSPATGRSIAWTAGPLVFTVGDTNLISEGVNNTFTSITVDFNAAIPAVNGEVIILDDVGYSLFNGDGSYELPLRPVFLEVAHGVFTFTSTGPSLTLAEGENLLDSLFYASPFPINGARIFSVTATDFDTSHVSTSALFTVTAPAAVKSLAYGTTTFVEAVANNGTITTTSTITLANDTFTGVDGDALGAVTNFPPGMTAVLVRTSATTATLSLTGTATDHANANDIANLTVTFADGDFTGGVAADVTNAIKADLVVDFADPAGGGGGGGGTVTPPPTDTDGVADTIENGVPNSSGTGTGDGNGDGVADATQNNVTSLDTGLTDAQGTHLYATIQNSGSGQQANVIHTPSPSNAELPAELQGSQFPLGVFSFDVTGVTPGGATTISLFVDGDLPVNGYLKQNAAGQWVSVPITITPVGNQQRIDFVIVDNGPQDRNPASGSISDPGGPVFRAVTPPPPPPPSTNHAPTGAVTISGIATQGQTLTAANTLADADGLGAIGYQWQANGTAISGATASTYVLTQAEVGKTLTVAARYTDGGGTAERVTSSATAAVANVNDAPTGAVTITGNAILGQTLTATNTLADADGLGTIGYQWQADGTAIGDATASTYVLTQEQVGKTITVAASYTDGGGALEQVISSPAIVDDDGINQAPVIASNGGGFTARLNVAENTTLVTQVRASDADGDALGYHLVGGVDQALFSLDAATGSLRFLAAPDYESPQGQSDIGADTPDNTYKVMVQVSDGQATDTQAITVTVTDVAENDGSDLDQDGMPDSVEAILGFNPQVKDNDVFANDALFVRQLYRDLLGREGEESGVTYWANDLQSGTLTRTQLIEPFLNSNEFQEGGGAIVRIYEGALGRSPDHDGFNYWMERVADGMSVRDIATVFADSEEFGQSYGALSDEAYVTTLTLNVLGREATAEESATWVSALADGGTRAEVLYGLVDSTEYRAASAEVVTLDMLYLGLLDRTLDDAGYVYWLAEIADADQPLDYVPNFYGSAEYHDRFLPAEPVTPLGLIGQTTAAEVTLG